MAKDIVDIAIGELGYRETKTNLTKYGQWMCMNGCAWCHMFVSWCAAQAGEASAVPYTANCSDGINWFSGRGLYRLKGQYNPKRGDIIYFGGTHVGIVERADSGMVYTIEGNSSDQVARRSYPLGYGSITGYGVPQYSSLNRVNGYSGSTGNTGSLGNVSGSGSSGSQTGNAKKVKKTSAEELAYLRKILEKKKKTPAKKISLTPKKTNLLPNVNVKVIVTNGKKQFTVPVKEGMKMTWERKGAPGKLTFEAVSEKKFKIVEGNSVLVLVDNVKMFYGFVFTRQKSKDGIMSYTVYDQLRYLKNKDTLIYKKKRADQLIQIIAERFHLNCGKLANTEYVISGIEDDSELFDMIQNALDKTLLTKNKMYVLYDKVGKLRLVNVANMKVTDCLVDGETGEDYTYKTTIDDGVYNQIKLVYENEDKGSYDLYIAKSSKSINSWGLLQYLEKIDSPDVGELKSQAYLKLYNRKVKNLTVSGVIGNKKVRAGSMVPVILKLGDVKVANYMLVDKVTHTFNNHQHIMDLHLSGGGFSAE